MATGSKRGGASRSRAGRSGAYKGNSRRVSTGRGKRKQGGDVVTDEVALLAVLAVSVLLFFSAINLTGSFGRAVSGVMFGLFGIGAYAVPFVIFFGGAFIISNKGLKVAGARAGAYVVLLLMLCSFAHMFSMSDRSETGLKEFYMICSEDRAGGGLFGAMIAMALLKTIGRAGAYIVLSVLVIICGVIITEKSFLNGIRTGSRHIFERSREGAKKHHQVRNVRREELKDERELKNRERALKREERRQERLEAVMEREEALSERRKKRSEMKVSGVMLDTKLVEEPVVPEAVDEEKELMLSESRSFGYAEETVTDEAAEDVSVAEEYAVPEGMHELSFNTDGMDEISIVEDIRDFKRTEYGVNAGVGERDAVNFRSSHHINSFKPETDGFHVSRDAETGPAVTEGVQAQDKIVPIRKPEDRVEPVPEETAAAEDKEPDIYKLLDEMAPEDDKETFSGDEPAYPETARKEPFLQQESRTESKEVPLPHEEAEKAEKAEPREYLLPSTALLDAPKKNNSGESMDELWKTADKLKDTLATFGVSVTMTEISQGPTVTRFEMQPESGVKVSKILSLSDDIKLNMAATDVRIEAPIPGKAAIGIEIPNKEPIPVSFRELVEDDAFKNAASKVSFAVGKDIEGRVVVTDIAKMPHLLIAGATGSGKSVCINTLIMSILYKADPEDVKLIMIDPKVVELSVYNGIPHLMIPVVTDPRKASAALQWGVVEMDDRYNKFAEYKVRDMKGFNKLVTSAEFQDIPEEERPAKMPQIVIIVDELADLMMVASKEVEESICRIAQKARAAGIHLVVATQRPSVDVITGLIKANMPSRIAFSVSSGTDSRTILDMVGAEKLLGKGDMLFYPQGYSKPARLQGAFVSDDEVTRVVDELKSQTEGEVYDEEVISRMNSAVSDGGGSSSGGLSSQGEGNGFDELFEKAARFIIEKDKASIGMLQRAFKIGFNRAARIMDQLSDAGVVGEEEGTKPRKILMSEEQFEQYVEETL